MRALPLALLALALGCATAPEPEPMIWASDGAPRATFEQARSACAADHLLHHAALSSARSMEFATARFIQCMNGYGWMRIPAP